MTSNGNDNETIPDYVRTIGLELCPTPTVIIPNWLINFNANNNHNIMLMRICPVSPVVEHSTAEVKVPSSTPF